MKRDESSDRPVRVGLLGCGRIARIVHLDVLQRLDGCELVAVADNDPARLADVRAGVRGLATFEDYTGLLDGVDVDAVVIALPTPLHADATVAALELGKHVYVEKPLAPTTAEATPILEAWRRAGTVGAVGYAFRFHPLARSLKAAIVSGAIGDVVGVRTSFCAASRELPEWKRSRATGGGALVDLASHHIDLVRFLFEREVEEASAVLRTVRTPEDTVLVDLALEGGLPVQMLASATAVQEDVVEVYGTRGKLVADRFGSRELGFVPSSSPRTRSHRIQAGLRRAARLRDVVMPPTEPSFATALGAWLAATRGIAFDGATLTDGYRALLIVEAAEQSARTGRRTRVAADQLVG